jgi:plastocyanin
VSRLRLAIRGGARRVPRPLLPLSFGLALLVAAQALGADATVRSSSAQRYSPSNPTPRIPGGGTLDFQNAAAGTPHSVTANVTGPDGRALFMSGTFMGRGGGVTRAVKGVQYLSPGTYKFHCMVHPTTMNGTLTVTAGSPVARPDIDVSILSSKIGRVRRTKRLEVEVDATTKSNNVALVAKKGSKTLAHKSNADLGAGDSQRISMRLTKKGKRALKGRHRATVTLTGTVPFGAPASDRRTLK